MSFHFHCESANSHPYHIVAISLSKYLVKSIVIFYIIAQSLNLISAFEKISNY